MSRTKNIITQRSQESCTRKRQFNRGRALQPSVSEPIYRGGWLPRLQERAEESSTESASSFPEDALDRASTKLQPLVTLVLQKDRGLRRSLSSIAIRTLSLRLALVILAIGLWLVSLGRLHCCFLPGKYSLKLSTSFW